MRKMDNDWGIVALHKDLAHVQINGAFYPVDTNTAALCHSILLLVDAVNDKSIRCCHGQEMDSESNKASRCTSQGNGCAKGEENSRKETSRCC